MVSLTLKLTNKCNFDCKYCIFKNNDNKSLDIDKVDKFLNNFPEINNIRVTGGEPLIEFEKLSVLVSKIRNKNIKIEVITNSSLLDQEKIDFFKKHNIKLIISFDGGKSSNDFNRVFENNKGSFDSICKKLSLIKKNNLPLNITMTLDPSNVSDLYENFEYILKQQPKEINLTPVLDKIWKDSEVDNLNKQLKSIVDLYSKHIVDYPVFLSLLNFSENRKGDAINKAFCFEKCGEHLYLDVNCNLFFCGSELYLKECSPIASINEDVDEIKNKIKNAEKSEIKPCLKLNPENIKNSSKIVKTFIYNADYLIDISKKDHIIKEKLAEIIKNQIKPFSKDNFMAATLKNQTRHISITVTNFCQNNCSYCRRPVFNKEEFDIKKFRRIITWLKKNNVSEVFIWGGEPTLHSKFNDLLETLKDNNTKCKLITNGRFKNADFFEYLGNTISSMGFHLPTLTDNERDEWGKEACENIEKFKSYISSKDLRIPLGLVNVIDKDKWDWHLLFTLAKKYNSDFVGFCFAHPNFCEEDAYLSYNQRLKIMPDVFDAFFAFEKNKTRISLDFFMPCLVDDSIKGFSPNKQKFIKNVFLKSYTPMRMYDINITNNLSAEIRSTLFDDNILVTPDILDFDSLESLEAHIEKKLNIESKNKKWPKKCLNCRHFNKTCKGDHYSLISEFEESK